MGQIVVGYDGSACGDAALDSALELAGDLGDRIVVVFGYAPPGSGAARSPNTRRRSRSSARR